MAKVIIGILVSLLLMTNLFWVLAIYKSANTHLEQSSMAAPATEFCQDEFSVRVVMHTAVGLVVRCLPRCDSEKWLRCPIGWSCVENPGEGGRDWVPVGACSPP